jgi:hypothetical protein
MSSIEIELALVALGAMLSLTTLSWSVLALVVAERPLRTGFWFYTGALGVTLLIGVAAAFVLGHGAASPKPSTPKTWVAIVDVVAATLLLAYLVRAARKPANLRWAGLTPTVRSSDGKARVDPPAPRG